jgi:hypothetical protein
LLLNTLGGRGRALRLPNSSRTSLHLNLSPFLPPPYLPALSRPSIYLKHTTFLYPYQLGRERGVCLVGRREDLSLQAFSSSSFFFFFFFLLLLPPHWVSSDLVLPSIFFFSLSLLILLSWLCFYFLYFRGMKSRISPSSTLLYSSFPSFCFCSYCVRCDIPLPCSSSSPLSSCTTANLLVSYLSDADRSTNKMT